MSRILSATNRIPLSREKELDLFQSELDFYRNHNLYPVVLFGKSIINIYRRINVQLVLTKKCGYKCGFCIENDNFAGQESNPNKNFQTIIIQYINQGIEPCVSITGGEPTLYPDRLIEALSVAKTANIKAVNVNTNGANLRPIKDIDGFRINLSRHHFEADKIKHIFGTKVVDTLLPGRTVMQCVMMQGFIDSVAMMKQYMTHFIQQGAVGFSFRGLSKLDAGKEYDKEVNFSAAHAIDFFQIANAVAADPEFEFVQQKIGDHYWFEIYKYRGFFVRLTYSNFEWLRQVEAKERANKQWFSRATIVSADGHVYAGWTYDINRII